MPDYKLYYYVSRGRGELARLIFNYAGVSFEDNRFTGLEWPSIKPKMPFGQVPVLEVDGKMLCQSYTIARYLAHQFGIAEETEWEKCQADMYADNVYDLHNAMRLTSLETGDPAKQKEMVDKVVSETIQPHLPKIEEQLMKNGSGFLVGKAITWADIAYYAYFTTPVMRKFGGDVLVNAPHLKKLVETVGNVSNIKNYIESRPATLL